MKRLQLTIAEPCHEAWNNMTHEQQGRFCAACQKTVVDFTTMSDRQLAAYFRQSSGSVCGRFYGDQLDRPIPVAAPEFPFPKKLFPYALPAYLLFLQSCAPGGNHRLKVVGLLKETTVFEMPPVMGNVLPEMTPVNPVRPPVVTSCFLPPVVKGEVEAIVKEDTLAAITDADTAMMAPDTVNCPTTCVPPPAVKYEQPVMMGRVAVNTRPEKKTVPVVEPTLSKDAEAAAPLLFPNPVVGGSQLHMQFDRALSGVYLIYSASGQLMQSGKFLVGKSGRLSVPIGGWSAGSYFLHISEEEGKQTISQQFIVQ